MFKFHRGTSRKLQETRSKSSKSFRFQKTCVLLLVTCILISNAWADPSPVKDLLELVEKHQGNWVAFKAQVHLEASRAGNAPASCDGQLAYERLSEKMMLLCVGKKKNLLFAFKAEDRQFEFYQSAAQAVYYGNIFDLEDDPAMDSHIKPLHLFRAFKLNAIAAKDAQVFIPQSPAMNTLGLEVRAYRHKKPYMKRRLVITPEGDVPIETYFRPDGKTDVTITRSNFKEIKNQGLSKKEIYFFPEQVTLEEPAKMDGKDISHSRKTTLTFDRFDFDTEIAFKGWDLAVPEGTKRVNVSEAFNKIEKQAS